MKESYLYIKNQFSKICKRTQSYKLGIRRTHTKEIRTEYHCSFIIGDDFPKRYNSVENFLNEFFDYICRDYLDLPAAEFSIKSSETLKNKKGISFDLIVTNEKLNSIILKTLDDQMNSDLVYSDNGDSPFNFAINKLLKTFLSIIITSTCEIEWAKPNIFIKSINHAKIPDRYGGEAKLYHCILYTGSLGVIDVPTTNHMLRAFFIYLCMDKLKMQTSIDSGVKIGMLFNIMDCTHYSSGEIKFCLKISDKLDTLQHFLGTIYDYQYPIINGCESIYENELNRAFLHYCKEEKLI